MSWFRAFEPWLVERLLRTPAFHRFVERVHKSVRRIKHGEDLEDMGGTKLDNPRDVKQFLDHFKEELRDQLRGKPPPKS